MNKMFFKKCLKRTDNITDLAIDANQSYLLIMMLRDIQYYHNEIMNISPAFYHTVIRNTMQALFVDLAKMFDEDKRSESTYTLLKDISDNITQLENSAIVVNEFESLDSCTAKTKPFLTFEKMINHYLNLIEENKSDIDSIKKLRNKFYAHLDRISADKIVELFKKYEVSLATIGNLLVLNMNICNALNCYFHQKTVMPHMDGYDDYKRTISCLEKYKELSNKYKDYS